MTEVGRAQVALRDGDLADLAVQPRRVLLLGSGPDAMTAASHARGTGCQVALCAPTDPRPDPSAIRPLLERLAESDAVGILRGAGGFLDHPAFDAQPRAAGQVWVAAGNPSGPPPVPVHLVVLTEPASPGCSASSGYLAWLATQARSAAAPGGSVAMWLQGGGFLLVEPDRTTVVPCAAVHPPTVAPSPESITAVVAVMLDADLDVVGALEATTRELSRIGAFADVSTALVREIRDVAG
jgi:hypothetical protein